MKLYIVAGERSGDQHAGRLLSELRALRPDITMRGVGGECMQEAGVGLYQHYREISFMGVYEVARKLGTLLSALTNTRNDLVTFAPDAVLLVDFGGFNMRLAKQAKKLGLPVYYYITPKVWAWNTSRVKAINALINLCLVILPFEVDFFAKHGVKSEYVGNPTVDAVASFVPDLVFKIKNRIGDKPVIAILPGSRKQEIEGILHMMVSVAPAFPSHRFVVAAVSNLPSAYYGQFTRNDTIGIVYDDTFNLLAIAEAALVTSGTATLETALFDVPQVVCYKTTALTALVAWIVMKVKFISLVNLIADREVVRELIQSDFVPANILSELKAVIAGGAKREAVLQGYGELRAKLGSPGGSRIAAERLEKELCGLKK